MPKHKVSELSYSKIQSISERSVSELQEYDIGEIVDVDGEGSGIVGSIIEESFEFPVSDEEEEDVDASSDNPAYIVALMDGGSVVATSDEISGDASIDDDGKEIEDWSDVSKDVDGVEMSSVYKNTDNPVSLEAHRLAKKRHVLSNNHTALSNASFQTFEDKSVEQLINIRGVDDPGVGFDELPDGWTRKSVLQAWASLGGTWSTCYPRMIREFGPNGAKRFCAALKDEVYGTERWRNRW